MLCVGNRYRTDGRPVSWEARYTTVILTFRPFVRKGGGRDRFRGDLKKKFCCVTVKPFLFELKHSGLSSIPGGHSKEDWVEV